MEDPDGDCSMASLDLYMETLEEENGGSRGHAHLSPHNESSMSSFDLYGDLDVYEEKEKTEPETVTDADREVQPSLDQDKEHEGIGKRRDVDWWIAAHRALQEKYAALEEQFATLNKNMMSLCVTARTEIKKKDNIISQLRKILAAAKSEAKVSVTTGTSTATLALVDAAVSTDLSDYVCRESEATVETGTSTDITAMVDAVVSTDFSDFYLRESKVESAEAGTSTATITMVDAVVSTDFSDCGVKESKRTVETGTSTDTTTMVDAVVGTDLNDCCVRECSKSVTSCSTQTVNLCEEQLRESVQLQCDMKLPQQTSIAPSAASFQGLQMPDNTQSPIVSQASAFSGSCQLLPDKQDPCVARSSTPCNTQAKTAPQLESLSPCQRSVHISGSPGGTSASPRDEICCLSSVRQPTANPYAPETVASSYKQDPHACERSPDLSAGKSPEASVASPCHHPHVLSLSLGPSLEICAHKLPPAVSPLTSSNDSVFVDTSVDNSFDSKSARAGQGAKAVLSWQSPTSKIVPDPTHLVIHGIQDDYPGENKFSKVSIECSRGSPVWSVPHDPSPLSASQLMSTNSASHFVSDTKPNPDPESDIGYSSVLQDSTKNTSEVKVQDMKCSDKYSEMAIETNTSDSSIRGLENASFECGHGAETAGAEPMETDSESSTSNAFPAQRSALDHHQYGGTAANSTQRGGCHSEKVCTNRSPAGSLEPVTYSTSYDGVQESREVAQNDSPVYGRVGGENTGRSINSRLQYCESICESVENINRALSFEARNTSPKARPADENLMEGRAVHSGGVSSADEAGKIPSDSEHHCCAIEPSHGDSGDAHSIVSPTHTVVLSYQHEKPAITAVKVPSTAQPVNTGMSTRRDSRSEEEKRKVNGNFRKGASWCPPLQDVKGATWKAVLKQWPAGVCDVVRTPRPRPCGQQITIVHTSWKSPVTEHHMGVTSSEVINPSSSAEHPGSAGTELQEGISSVYGQPRNTECSQSSEQHDQSCLMKDRDFAGVCDENKPNFDSDIVAKKKKKKEKKKKEKRKKSKKSSKKNQGSEKDTESLEQSEVGKDSHGSMKTSQMKYEQPAESKAKQEADQTIASSKENKRDQILKHREEDRECKVSDMKENTAVKNVLTEVSPQKSSAADNNAARLELAYRKTKLSLKENTYSLSPKKKGCIAEKSVHYCSSHRSINAGMKESILSGSSFDPFVSKEPDQVKSKTEMSVVRGTDSSYENVLRDRLKSVDTDDINIYTDESDGDVSPLKQRMAHIAARNLSILRQQSVDSSHTADVSEVDLPPVVRRARQPSSGEDESKEASARNNAGSQQNDQLPPEASLGGKSSPPPLSSFTTQDCVNPVDTNKSMSDSLLGAPKPETVIQTAAVLGTSMKELEAVAMEEEESESQEPFKEIPLCLFGSVEVTPVTDRASPVAAASADGARENERLHRLKPSVVPSLLWSPDKSLMSKPVIDKPMSSRSYNAFLGLAECTVTMDDSNMMTAQGSGNDDSTAHAVSSDTQKQGLTFPKFAKDSETSQDFTQGLFASSKSHCSVAECGTERNDGTSNLQPSSFNSPLFSYPANMVKLKGGARCSLQQKHAVLDSSSSTSVSSLTTSGCVSSTSTSQTSLTSQSPVSLPTPKSASKSTMVRRRSLGFDAKESSHDDVEESQPHAAVVQPVSVKQTLPQQEPAVPNFSAVLVNGKAPSSLKPSAQGPNDGHLERSASPRECGKELTVSSAVSRVFDSIEESLEEGELRSCDSFPAKDNHCKPPEMIMSPGHVSGCVAGDNAQFTDLRKADKQKIQETVGARSLSESWPSLPQMCIDKSGELASSSVVFRARNGAGKELVKEKKQTRHRERSAQEHSISSKMKGLHKKDATSIRDVQEPAAREVAGTQEEKVEQESCSGNDEHILDKAATGKRRRSSSSRDSPPSKRTCSSPGSHGSKCGELHSSINTEFASQNTLGITDGQQTSDASSSSHSVLGSANSGTVQASSHGMRRSADSALDDEFVCVDKTFNVTEQEDSVVDDGECVSDSGLELPGCARTRVYFKLLAADTMTGEGGEDSGDEDEEDQSCGEDYESEDERNNSECSSNEDDEEGEEDDEREEARDRENASNASEDEESKHSFNEPAGIPSPAPVENQLYEKTQDSGMKERRTLEGATEEMEQDSDGAEDGDADVPKGQRDSDGCSELEQSDADSDYETPLTGVRNERDQSPCQPNSPGPNSPEHSQRINESQLTEDLMLSSDSELDEVFEEEEPALLDDDLPALESLGEPVAKSSCRELSEGECEDSSSSADCVPVASNTSLLGNEGNGRDTEVFSAADGKSPPETPVKDGHCELGDRHSQQPNWSMDCISLEVPEGLSLLVGHKDASFHNSTSGRVFAAVSSEELHHDMEKDLQMQEKSNTRTHSKTSKDHARGSRSAEPETLRSKTREEGRQKHVSVRSDSKKTKGHEKKGRSDSTKLRKPRQINVPVTERLRKLSEGSACSESEHHQESKRHESQLGNCNQDQLLGVSDTGHYAFRQERKRSKTKSFCEDGHQQEETKGRMNNSRKPTQSRRLSDSRSVSRERNRLAHSHRKSRRRSATPDQYGHSRRSGRRTRSPVAYHPCPCCTSRRHSRDRASPHGDQHNHKESLSCHHGHEGRRGPQAGYDHRSRRTSRDGDREDYHRCRYGDKCAQCHAGHYGQRKGEVSRDRVSSPRHWKGDAPRDRVSPRRHHSHNRNAHQAKTRSCDQRHGCACCGPRQNFRSRSQSPSAGRSARERCSPGDRRTDTCRQGRCRSCARCSHSHSRSRSRSPVRNRHHH